MKRKSLEVTRFVENSVDETGTVVVAEDSVFTIKASVQPADRIQLESNEELRDYKQVFELFHKIELYTADAELSKQADKVSIYGKDFEVVTCEPWTNGIRSHYKSLVAR